MFISLIFIYSENSYSWSAFCDVLNCSQKHFRIRMPGEWLHVVCVIRVKLLGHLWFDIVVYGTINTGIRLSLPENHLSQRKTPLSLYLIKISVWEHWEFFNSCRGPGSFFNCLPFSNPILNSTKELYFYGLAVSQQPGPLQLFLDYNFYHCLRLIIIEIQNIWTIVVCISLNKNKYPKVYASLIRWYSPLTGHCWILINSLTLFNVLPF